MDLSPDDMLYKNRGIQAVVIEISKKEKFLRKIYIGVLRLGSVRVRVMMVMFPEKLNM